MPQEAGTTVDLRVALIKALEDEQYDWRTIPGLCKSLGTTPNEILPVLNSMAEGTIVRTTADDGRALYTTLAHYEKTHGFGTKLLSALADKVVA